MNKLIAVLPGEGQTVTIPCMTTGETRYEVWLGSGADKDADNGTVVFDFGDGHTVRIESPNVFEVRDGAVALGVGLVSELQDVIAALAEALTQ